MKLKKLELYGFKSFADRTVFEFEDSLSALVGPNGSGKSNVVDGIKWVLGERSAKSLRGVEMANVIFGGSETRKPVNFADVKLTIDNSDGWLPVEYHEVCIHRRMDTTGQSEYFMNGQQCRLKDIRQLLMDTGVGTDCYSVIEQGQIDRILRASPKERREVFEEAAGINRFLEQKKEAERKLERVGINLTRVNDILEELDRQLRSVKYQAARARTFRLQAERLQRLRLAHGLHSYRALQAEKDQHAAAIQSALTQRNELAEQAAAAEKEIAACRARLQEAQNELAESQQRLARIDGRLDSLAHETELNEQRCRELEEQLQELNQRRSGLEERVRHLTDQVAATLDRLQQSAHELTEKSAALEAAQQRLENLRAQYRHAQDGLETRKAEVFDLFQQEAHLRNQIEVLGAERRALQSRLERIESRRQELTEQAGQTESERARTQEKLDALNCEQSKLNAAMDVLKRAAAQAASLLNTVASQQTEAKADLSGRLGRRDLLSDLEARAEGVHSGVKRLLEARLPGMVGLLAHMIEVPLEHAAAVEAAMGDRAQAVLFERATEAAQALKLLSDEKAGRAEVIVLEHVTPPAASASGDLGSVPGLVGRLADVVRYDERAAPAVQALLGNAILVEDADRALALLRAGLPPQTTLVTPAGERYGTDGVWAAGVPEGASLISRRSELAALEGQVGELQAKLAALTEDKERCATHLRELEGERDALASRIEELKRSGAEAAGHLRALAERSGELQDELHLAGAEQAGLCQDVADLQARSAALQQESARAQEQRAQAQSAAQAEQESLRSMLDQQQALADEAGALSSDVVRTREQQRSFQELTERLQADKRDLESELTSLHADRDSSAKHREEAARALESARAESEALKGEKETLVRALESGAAAVQQMRDRTEALTNESADLAQQREQLGERLHSLRMTENETAIKTQDMLERMAEDYGVRLKALELEPEQWRDNPPFTAKVIREFAENLPEARPAEAVAAWYREQEAAEPGAAGAEGEQEREDAAPEVVSLEEAAQLRCAVLEMAADPATDWEHVKAEMASLKAKVERIGNVNVAAIRQQEELEVRLQFLTDQKEDLETARRHEREIIRELNRKSRERFVEVFEQVRRNFQGLFRKLFGGGTADIVLQVETEEEDVLEAGVEVIARPPGKETSSITLLSGGEKALTTIALLFAIFQAKPSPFCLLDEVDAPLDDNNVERFLMLLAEFRASTQFIIITHNKMTMSVAQVLYGLTMTGGVSQKISVKFEEVEGQLERAA